MQISQAWIPAAAEGQMNRASMARSARRFRSVILVAVAATVLSSLHPAPAQAWWYGGGWGWGRPWGGGWGRPWGWGYAPGFVYAPPPVIYAQPPAIYAPPAVTYTTPAPAYTAPSAPAWYYCNNPRGYYPTVQACPGGWQQVPATPSANSQ